MYIYMDIIKEFSCEMCGQCCRNDWQVTMDEESYWRNFQLFIKRSREEEFSRAFVPIVGNKELGEYAFITKKKNGGCWFLGENNLCQLQGEAGHSHLDAVCQTFPRYPMNTSRGIELTLSFSCPAVIKIASRMEPLAMIRSKEQPIAINSNNDIVHVYPEQKGPDNPLRYYFEIEHHFIDLLQARTLTMGQRIQLLTETVQKISGLQQNEMFGQNLSRVIYENYDLLDRKDPPAQSIDEFTSEMLKENFFVNFVFKKPFYVYGLQRGMFLLDTMWRKIETKMNGEFSVSRDIELTTSVIMELEFQYSHNRRALLHNEGRKG